MEVPAKEPREMEAEVRTHDNKIYITREQGETNSD